MSQLGRISGHLLDQNLTREGVDLYFSNTTFDTTPVLYLDVVTNKIGIKTDAPVYDLDIRTDVKTTNAIATSVANIDNIIIKDGSYFTTKVGPINIEPTDGTIISLERIATDDLYINDNVIGGLNSAQPIQLSPSGSGTVEVSSRTTVNGNLNITGNLLLDGDLSAAGHVTVGDSPLDVVVISPDLTQDIIPGDDNKHELGQQANDSSARRWDQLWTPDLTNVGTNRPDAVKVSDQMWINGVTNELFAMQSDDDIFLSPDTQINWIEGTRWHQYTASATQATLLNKVLTVSGTTTGFFLIGMQLSGPGIYPGTVITGYTTGSDSTGVYEINISYDGLTPTLGIGTPPNPNPILTPIAITGAIDVIENMTDYGGEVRVSPETPLVLTNTGIGYVRFMGTNGFILPAGDDAERPSYPELGDTRWNFNSARLECFAGEIEAYSVAGSVAGLPDQIINSGPTTSNGPGEEATFRFTVLSGVLSTELTEVGKGYNQGDTIAIPGTLFTGGTSPTNDLTITIGLQTDAGYKLSTGGGAEVNVPLMEDLADVYSLILG